MLLEAKKAEDRHVQLVHSHHHVNLIKNISSKAFKSRRSQIASKLNSIYFNEGSSEAAFLAVGSAIEVMLSTIPSLYKEFSVFHSMLVFLIYPRRNSLTVIDYIYLWQRFLQLDCYSLTAVSIFCLLVLVKITVFV